MNRRNFLRTGAALGLPLISGSPLYANLTNRLQQLVSTDSDRVLVLVQLTGGNDGLSTLVPLDQFSRLMQVRSNLLVPENNLLGIDNALAFHPSAAGLHRLYQDGKMAAVQGVAYPDQNRSHFRSMDIWTSASAADEVVTTGWLGRNFQEDAPEFPDDYPNEDNPHPFALAMGNQVSQTCQGVGTNFSMAVTDPFNLLSLAGGDDNPLPDSYYGEELGFLRTSIAQANAYGEVVLDVAEQGQSLVDYPDTRFASDLKNVAYLISGGLRTSVYVVTLGGFDTHANQVVNGDPQTGVYAELLQTLGDGLAAFHQDLTAQGLDDRVLSMTFSEFGRRIRSNQSLGSDHGTAAPLFLMGNCVESGILGSNPEIGTDVAVDEGVPMQYDFRDVYGTVFQDWFNLAPEDVRAILAHDYVHLPILGDCDSTSTSSADQDEIYLRVWPNPSGGDVEVSFNFTGGAMNLTVSDAAGRLVEQTSRQSLPAGEHRLKLNLRDRPAGIYFVRVQSGITVSTRRVVRK